MQTFFATIAGQTISVVNGIISGEDNKNNNGNVTRIEIHTPHPTVTEWVWTVGVEEEYVHRIKKRKTAAKFYASMVPLVTGLWHHIFFKKIEEEEQEESDVWVAEYFRSLFRHTFEEGKKIVIGAEFFDTLVADLKWSSASSGKETHVSPRSSKMIDVTMNLLPWNITTETVPPLRMEDIEVEINY